MNLQMKIFWWKDGRRKYIMKDGKINTCTVHCTVYSRCVAGLKNGWKNKQGSDREGEFLFWNLECRLFHLNITEQICLQVEKILGNILNIKLSKQ